MATPLTTMHLDEVSSTQDVARAEFGGQPALVTATSQTAGRGRSGSPWQNAPRALAASLAFAPEWDSGELPRITLIAGLAATDALGEGSALKWPNDVVRASAKVAGLLTEHNGGVVVVGMGVNLWWPSAPQGMGAVFGDDPGSEAGPALAGRWASRLLGRVAKGPDRWGRDEYVAKCVTLGHGVTWQPSGHGRAIGIAEDGALIVEGPDGRVHLDSGAVTMVRTDSSES